MGATILLKTVTVEQPINITDLTDTTVGGVGVFDRMLCTMKAHLEIEYEKGRITGSDYANVFLGSYQATLQQSASFLLEKEKQAYELDKLNSDRDLVLAQIEQVLAQTLLTQVQTANAELESGKITREIEQLAATIALTDVQTEMLSVQTEYEEFKNAYIQPKELEQITEQVANLTSQGNLIDEQISTLIYDRTVKSPVELANIVKQGAIMDQQILVQQSEVLLKGKEIELATAKLLIDAKQLDVLIAQVAAQQAQSLLYSQKVVTEKAQVDNTVVGADSAIDQQNKLLKAQRDGYQRDAEQKVAKLMIDTWNVRKNADEATLNDFVNLLDDKNVGLAVDAMFDGIGRAAYTV